MTETHTPRTDRPLTQTEAYLAINRAVEVHKTLDWAHADQGQPTEITDQLHTRLIALHKQCFQDTHAVATEHEAAAGELLRETSQALRGIISRMMHAVYNEHGQSASTLAEEVKRAIVNAYGDFMAMAPFDYGNGFVFRQFLFGLMQTTSVGDKFATKFDWRRVEQCAPDAMKALEQDPLNTDAFAKALDAGLEAKVITPPSTDPWPTWSSSTEKVGQYHFLKATVNEQPCFVALDGTAVPVAKVKEKLEVFLATQDPNTGYVGHPADFTISRADSIGNILTGKKSNATHVDGIPVSDDAVPLMCVNIDHLTGLVLGSAQNDPFLKFLKDQKVDVLDVPEKKTQLLQATISDPNMHARIKRAATRIAHVRPTIQAAVAHALEGKSSPKRGNPHFFMAMGGTGAGKSMTQDYARQLCGGGESGEANLVEASLDDARGVFAVYDLYAKAGHLSDDYISLSTAGNQVRDGIVQQATAKGYHLFFDGSGAPYKGRFDAVIAAKKHVGYDTHVLAVEAPLYVAEGRRDLGWPAYKRIVARYEATGRAVPFTVMLDKHTKFPSALLDAAVDTNLDHLLLFDNGRGAGQHSVLAEMHTVGGNALAALQEAQSKGPEALHAALTEMRLLPVETNDKAPPANPANTDLLVLAKRSTSEQAAAEQMQYRVLAITDMPRFLDSMAKSQYNNAAAGPQALTFNPHANILPSLDGGYAKWVENSRTSDGPLLAA